MTNAQQWDDPPVPNFELNHFWREPLKSQNLFPGGYRGGGPLLCDGQTEVGRDDGLTHPLHRQPQQRGRWIALRTRPGTSDVTHK